MMTPSIWFARPTPEPAAFLAVIGRYLPAESVLYVEGTEFSAEAKALFLRHISGKSQKMTPDTVAPQPQAFHLDATANTLEELAELIRRNPSVRWGHHLKIYDSDGLLVDWHDADTGWFLLLSSRFSKEVLRSLRGDLGCYFKSERLGA
jgi:hypothetical protein